MPGVPPGVPGAASVAGMPFPNPAAMFATLDPEEVGRKIDELKVVADLAADEPQHDAVEHQDPGAPEGIARGPAGTVFRRRFVPGRLQVLIAPIPNQQVSDMSIVLYYGSGSPFAWRVQLALEHKALPYDRKVLSFSAGDTMKPEFLALTPRHRVPVIVDGDFVLYESNAIVEYLEDAYPTSGARLFPGDARTRALARRLIMEVDSYFDEAIDPLTTQAFSLKPEERDAQTIAEGRAAVCLELSMFTKAMKGRVSRWPAFGGRLRALPVR